VHEKSAFLIKNRVPMIRYRSQKQQSLDARLVIGAVIIKHKLCLSDRETVAQIQENPYLQYFVGLPGYQMEVPFVPALLVEIRTKSRRL